MPDREFFSVLHGRSSIRVFQERKVEGPLLDRIVGAALSAPSAGNLQAYKIVVVEDRRARSALARAACDQEFIAVAPVVLIFFADPAGSARRYGKRGADLYATQDATIACAYAQLAASALDLGSVWVGAFRDQEVRKAVGAPEDLMPVALLPIGYPREDPEKTSRLSASALVHHNRF